MADNWMLKAVLKADSSSMIKSLDAVGKIAKNTRKYLSDIASSTGKLGSSLGLPVAALSGVIGGFSLMAVKSAVVGFTDMGEAIKKGALKAGMSVQEYQRMKYVADQSGTSIEAMEGSLGKLNRQMGDAANGKNKDLASLMKRLGVSMRDVNGSVVRGIDVLPKIADAFKRNENPTTRARMGMAMFGKSYAEILPLLVEGSKGIDDNLKRFDKIKGVLGDKEIDEAKDLGDSFKDLDLVMKGFQGTIAKELVPVIKPMVDGLVAWWVANKKLVGVEVGKMAKDLAIWVKKIDFAKLLADTGDFFRSLGGLVDMVGGAKNALIGLVIVMNMQTISAFFGVISATWRLVYAFGAFAATSIPKMLIALGLYTPAATGAAVATGAVATATDAANVAALAWVGNLKAVLGVLGSIGIAAAPLIAMWGVKEWAEDQSNDKGRVEGIQRFASMFGFNKDDEFEARRRQNRAELDGDYPSLVTPAKKAEVGGKITFDFQNAPPGMRLVDQQTSGGPTFDVNMGWRSFALGMP